MKKRVFVMLCIIAILLFWNFNSFIPVKYATSIFNAYWKLINNDGIIIYYDDNGLGSYYKTGLAREYITLIGRNPYNEISGRLLKNKILVQGEFQKDISDFYGRKIFKVTDWNIIFPVIREYSLSDYQKSRFIYPIFYVDKFDVETEDMNEYKNADRSISGVEAEYRAFTDNTNYFIITPEILDNTIMWHEIEYTDYKNYDLKETVSRKAIKLNGDDLPENSLNANILFNDNSLKYANRFLIHGYRQNEGIYVKSWQIITPFENKIENGGKKFLGETDYISLAQ